MVEASKLVALAWPALAVGVKTLDSHGCCLSCGELWCDMSQSCVTDMARCEAGSSDLSSCTFTWAAALNWDLSPLRDAKPADEYYAISDNYVHEALTEKEKTVAEESPAEPPIAMGISPDMDETGAGCAERRPWWFSNYLSGARVSRDLAGRASDARPPVGNVCLPPGGIVTIPFIVKPLDELAEVGMDVTLRKIWSPCLESCTVSYD